MRNAIILEMIHPQTKWKTATRTRNEIVAKNTNLRFVFSSPLVCLLTGDELANQSSSFRLNAERRDRETARKKWHAKSI